MPELPDFDELARAAAQAGIPNSPSELHGVVCGLLATGHGQDDNALLGTLAAHAEQPEGGGGAPARSTARGPLESRPPVSVKKTAARAPTNKRRRPAFDKCARRAR